MRLHVQHIDDDKCYISITVLCDDSDGFDEDLITSLTALSNCVCATTWIKAAALAEDVINDIQEKIRDLLVHSSVPNDYYIDI